MFITAEWGDIHEFYFASDIRFVSATPPELDNESFSIGKAELVATYPSGREVEISLPYPRDIIVRVQGDLDAAFADGREAFSVGNSITNALHHVAAVARIRARNERLSREEAEIAASQLQSG